MWKQWPPVTLISGGSTSVNNKSAGVTDSLIVRTVAFPVQVAYWTKRSWPLVDTVSHVNFDQWSGDMAVGSCGMVAIIACMTEGVSSARLQDQSSRKVRVRPLLMEPGTRQRHS